MNDLYDEILNKNPRWHWKEYPSITVADVAEAQRRDGARKNELLVWAYCELRLVTDTLKQAQKDCNLNAKLNGKYLKRIDLLEAALREIVTMDMGAVRHIAETVLESAEDMNHD